MTGEEAAREAERFLSGFRRPDMVYLDPDYVNADIGDWVAVSTFGRADELTGSADEPEIAPVRLRVGTEDGDEAEAYLTIDEARAVINALRRAITKASHFPKPGDPWPPSSSDEAGTVAADG